VGKGKIDSFYLDVGTIIGNFPLFQWKLGGYPLSNLLDNVVFAG